MKALKYVKLLIATVLMATLGFSLVACTEEDGITPQEIKGLTGGIAATVNGAEIEEDTVTTYIEKLRLSRALTDEDSWGEWLAEGGFTPESIREEVINFYIGQELIRQEAEKNDISVEQSEIDEYVDQMKAYFETDEEWQTALEGSGLTEPEYRDSIEIALLEEKVQEALVETEEVTEEEVLQTVQLYGSMYDGAKRSSHILFDSEDKATAQEVLDKIKAGELDFAEAAKEYSKDSSAETGGDVGWDRANSFVAEYTEALEGLETDEMSDLVESDFGFHIIKVTEVFAVPEEVTSLDQFPEDLLDVEALRENLQSSKESEAVSEWYENLKEESDIKINDMPENLPYDVDMSKYETEDPEADPDAGIEDGADHEHDEDGNEIVSDPDQADPDSGEEGEGAEGTNEEDKTEGQPSETPVS